MKTFKHGIFGAVALLAISTLPSFAVVDQALEVQGTNLVLSWPSLGFEHYLVQYRPTLDPSTPWLDLTNNYPANSTNRTTYIVPCCILSALGGGSMAASFSGGMESSASGTMLEMNVNQGGAVSWDLMAVPANLSSEPVPLALYPPGMDTNGLIIFSEAELSKLEAEVGSTLSPPEPDPGAEPGGGETQSPPALTSGGCDCPSMGFFRVFHVPDWSFNVTNYTYDGPAFFPVDFKDYRDLVTQIEVLMNGVPYPHAEFTTYASGGQTNWGMGIYFDQLTNGNYQIQLVTTLQLNDEIGDNSVYLALTNLTQSIVVFNQVAFPDWNDFIQGDTYTFNAQLANPDTDWWIDIYDVWNNYVATGSGHTTNGQVSWTWDLFDWQGYNRDDFDSDPYFFSQITFNSLGDGPQITRPTRPPLKGYPNRGEWLVAFQDRWYSDAPYYTSDVQEKFLEAMTNISGGPILVGDTSYLYPLKFGTNVYTQAEREQSWTNLLTWIGDLYIRNFYFFGHGNAKSIGCDRHLLPLTNAPATGGATTSAQSKSLLLSWQVALKTRYNRYRFVFLDGCSTAAGDWPNAFNISKTNRTIQFYENDPKHPRPSVFVGWNEEIGAGTDTYKALDFRKNWMGIWANGSDHPHIKESLERANRIFGWLGEGVFNAKIRFYGYQEMKIGDYNKKGDWRWE